MPAEPKQYWRLIGPGIIAAGVGLASGEFILYPYIASQVGLVFVWAALVGLATQFFLNMEIERYTLATGETALTGFSRFWRHWGLVFAILTYFANLWPGWATSSATLISYIFGGKATWIAIGILLTVGLVLTLAPVVYTALERAQMLKVALVLTLILVASIFAIGANAWADLPQVVTRPRIPVELGFALLLGALAFAGAWRTKPVPVQLIRDKGFGMGSYFTPAGQSGNREASRRPEQRLHLRAQRGEHEALAGVVALLQYRTALHLRGDHLRHDLVHLAARLRDGVRPRGAAQQHRLHPNRGSGAGRAGRFLVPVPVLGDRCVLAVCSIDGHRRLHQPHSRRRDQDLLRPQCKRVQALRRPGLGPGAHRDHRAAGRHRPADRAAGHLGGDRRVHDVHVLGTVDLDQLQAGHAPIKIRGVRVAVLIWSILLFGTLSVLTFRAQLERLFEAERAGT